MQKIEVNVEETISRLVAQEDTNHDYKITIEDTGPKRFKVRSLVGYDYEVIGTYLLSNLLQELTLAKNRGERVMLLDPRFIFESPPARLSRVIRNCYWDNLRRSFSHEGLKKLVEDPKMHASRPARIYVPFHDKVGLNHYRKVVMDLGSENLQVERLPKIITPEFVFSLNNRPGLLALGLRKERGRYVAPPFLVPGGRFNEMYGWDCYFIALGLLADQKFDQAKSLVDHLVYQIYHYGAILNANRSYYLMRSNPPFLTSMISAVYKWLPPEDRSREWLRVSLEAAIKEYNDVWTTEPRLTPTGLSRYCSRGVGFPPETESGHYDPIVSPAAQRAGLSIEEYMFQFNSRKIENRQLQEYLLHDRSVRESGHDTSYRLDGIAGNLNSVDLNALLYKYESDLASLIDTEFDGEFTLSTGHVEKSAAWIRRAEERKERMNQLMWNEEAGFFFDYDYVHKRQIYYESATTFYTVWAGMASHEQVERLLEKALPKLEKPGGVVSTTEESRGALSELRPQRQWDYPVGWAPHQILIWRGLSQYGYEDIAQRLAYRWIHMMTSISTGFNGTVAEKYDVIERSHHVDAEYGNVGTEFEFMNMEGFGWSNAAYQVGLPLLSHKMRAQLELMTTPEWCFGPPV